MTNKKIISFKNGRKINAKNIKLAKAPSQNNDHEESKLGDLSMMVQNVNLTCIGGSGTSEIEGGQKSSFAQKFSVPVVKSNAMVEEDSASSFIF